MNFGVGFLLERNVRVLGNGIKEGAPLPGRNRAFRLTTAAGVRVISSAIRATP